jgi:hypothetical protein
MLEWKTSPDHDVIPHQAARPRGRAHDNAGANAMHSAARKRIIIIVCVVLAALLLPIVGLAGFAWYKIHQDLSQPPPLKASSQLAPDVPTSVLALNVTLPFERLLARAEAVAPKSYSGSGDGPDVCVTKPVKVCSGTRYDYSATRGAVALGPGPEDSLRISVPLKVTGHAGLRESGEQPLAVNAKSFELTSDAFVDVKLDMQPDWCPHFTVNTDFSNLSALVQVKGSTSVDVSKYLRSGLQKQLQKLGEQAAGVLKCDDIKKAVQDAWVTRSFPLALLGDPRALYVNVQPVSFGFSGVKVTSSSLAFLMSLGTQISVSDAALPSGTRPLPALTAVPLAKGGVQLSIPLRISYQGLDEHLQALFGRKPLSFPTPRGPAMLALNKFNIYPAGDKVAIGVHVNATFPDSYFNTGGWLYWTARPLLSADGKAVRLADIGYSQLADSELARMLRELLDKQIQSGLAAAGQFDLTESISKTTELVKSGLAGQGGKMSFDVGDATVKVGRVVLGQDALFVEAVFSSGADIVLGGAT